MHDSTARFKAMKGLLALLVVLAFFSAPGCGKKMWPEPVADQERFSWHNATARLDNGCLHIQATLAGRYANLRDVIVELEAADPSDLCLTCPFQPTVNRVVDADSPQLQRSGPETRVVLCGLDGTKAYRWRLKGSNIHDQIDPVATGVGVVGVPASPGATP
ncbi:MAG: hypothetical protein ACOCWT_02060 [Desulfohalobiaceae bacterium]